MQCTAKGENLAHILRYQIWAVTNLPPLQESRPEIPRVGRGKREEGNTTTLNFNDRLDPTTIFLVAEGKTTSVTCRRESQKIVQVIIKFPPRVGNMNFARDHKPLGKTRSNLTSKGRAKDRRKDRETFSETPR